MIGKKPGYETTSYSPDRPVYFNYYDEKALCERIERSGFFKAKSMHQSYEEPNGSHTRDVFLSFRRK